MTLSDGEILEALEVKRIEIKPFDEKNMTSNGYDLSVGGVDMKKKPLTPNQKMFIIPPLTAFQVVTMEEVTVSSSLTAELFLKTRHTRNGIQGTFGKVDAGFHGTLTLGLFNGNDEVYEMEKGSLVCQICFKQMERPAIKPYAERSGTYQNQKKKIKR